MVENLIWEAELDFCQARLGYAIIWTTFTTYYIYYITMNGMATGLFPYNLSGDRLGLALAPLHRLLCDRLRDCLEEIIPPPILESSSTPGYPSTKLLPQHLQAAKGRRKAVITLIEHRHPHRNILE
jgi:hypothetical protein